MHMLDNGSNYNDELVVDENENLVMRDSLSDAELDNSFGNLSFDKKTHFEKRNFFKLVSGDNIYRIMPPMFDGKERGIWFAYYSDHFGYIDSRGKKHKFLCTRKYDENGIMGRCLFCEDQENLKNKLQLIEQKISELNSAIASFKQNNDASDKLSNIQDEIASFEMQKTELKEKIRTRNTAFYVNAMDQAGNFGVLGLKKTVYEELAGKRNSNFREPGMFQDLKNNEKIDPLSPNEGVWFNITRTGVNFTEVKYRTFVVNETVIIDGKKLKSIKQAPLSNQQKQMALLKCQNLLTMFDHLKLTLEETKIVINGSPEAVTAVINAPTRKRNMPKSIDRKPINEEYQQEHNDFSSTTHKTH